MEPRRISRWVRPLVCCGLTSLGLVLGCTSEPHENMAASSQALGRVPGSWRLEGPQPILSGLVATGATHRAVFNPTNPRGLLVASVNGGLFRSDAAFDPAPVNPTWTALTDHLPSLSISAFAMDPLDPRHLVMITGRSASLGKATDQGLIHLSRDGGATWVSYYHPLVHDNYVSSVAVRGKLILASSTGPKRGPDDRNITAGGVFVSKNDGVDWRDLTQASAGLPTSIGPVRDLIADPTAPDAYYIAALDRGKGGAGLYRGTNNGDSWTRVSDNDTAPPNESLGHALGATAADGVRLSTAPNGMLFIEVTAAGHPVYMGYTRDQGQHFTAMETPKFLLFGSTPQQIKRVTRNGSSSIVVEAVAPHGLETSSPWLVRIDGVSG